LFHTTFVSVSYQLCVELKIMSCAVQHKLTATESMPSITNCYALWQQYNSVNVTLKKTPACGLITLSTLSKAGKG